MKTILKHVKFKSKQLVALFFLILLSAFGQMLLPALLSKMISLGVVTGENRTIWMFAAITVSYTHLSLQSCQNQAKHILFLTFSCSFFPVSR